MNYAERHSQGTLPGMAKDVRARMVEAAVRLLATKGLEGTSFAEVRAVRTVLAGTADGAAADGPAPDSARSDSAAPDEAVPVAAEAARRPRRRG